MSIDLILGLCGVAVTIMVIVGGVLAVPRNTEPAYDSARHPDGVDHGTPSDAPAITAGRQGIRR